MCPSASCYVCAPSIRTESGAQYLVMTEPVLATSSLPFIGSVTGTYRPIQTLDNYFWFQFEVAGIIENAEIR